MSGDKMATVKNITVHQIAPQMDLFGLTNKLDLSLIKCGGGDRGSILIPMGPYKGDSFTACVNLIKSSGGTPLAESLIKAFNELSNSDLEKRAHLHSFRRAG